MPNKSHTEGADRETTRVTIDLSPRLYARLKALTDLVEADSKAGVIRQALQLFEYIAEKSIVDGAKFRVIEPDGREENILFFLPSSEKSAHRPSVLASSAK